MAEIKDGYLSGKLGNLVGYRYKGKFYVRKRPQRTAPPTEAELKNRFVMELVSKWLQPLTPFLRIGFQHYHPNFSGFSAASSLLRKEALHKDGFNSSIDPSLVRLSYGPLGMSADLQVSLDQEELVFTWNTTIDATQGPRDRIMLLAYNIEAKEAIYELNGPKRYQGTARLSLAGAVPGIFHVYAAFISEDGSQQTNSQYLGQVSVSS